MGVSHHPFPLSWKCAAEEKASYPFSFSRSAHMKYPVNGVDNKKLLCRQYYEHFKCLIWNSPRDCDGVVFWSAFIILYIFTVHQDLRGTKSTTLTTIIITADVGIHNYSYTYHKTMTIDISFHYACSLFLVLFFIIFSNFFFT